MIDRLPRVEDNEARLRRLLDTWALIRNLAEDLGPALDLEVVLKTALEGMRRIVDFRGGTIQLIDDGGIYVAASHPSVSQEVSNARFPVDQGVSGQIISTGRAVYSPDLDVDMRVPHACRGLGSNAGIRSYLGVPLICLGETIGVMQVDSPEEDAFNSDDLAVLAGLATLVAGAVESARRFQKVIELERLKSDFIARASHELRTPITIIDGFLSTMLTYGDSIDAESQRNMLERSQTAVRRLAGLIEDLITLSRLETGVLMARPSEIGLRPLLGEVRARSMHPGLVTVECPSDVLITTDPDLFRRAVGFLVDNALKYGGRAHIDVAADGRSLSVRDSGPGIPDDVRATVFERFTQDNATAHVPGLGLGLPMARTLLDVLGADIRLGSSEGGTEVIIQLR